MGRGADDDRPAIELWGEAPADDRAPERVVVGAGGRRQGGLVLAAVVAVLVVAGLLLGDGGSEGGDTTTPVTREERDNRARDDLEPPPVGAGATTTRSRASSATSTTAVFGPVFGGGSGGAALVLASTSGTWTWLDLDTGERRALDISTDDVWSAMPMRHGVAVVRDGTARFVSLPDGAEHDLGPADQLVSSGSPDSVWLVSTAFAVDGGPTSIDARLVEPGAATLRRVSAPIAYAVAGTQSGLIFNAQGRAFLADEDGMHLLAPDEVIAVSAERIAGVGCDDEARCSLTTTDLATGARRILARVPPPGQFGMTASLSPDGRLALLRYDGVPSITLFAASGEPLGTVEVIDGGGPAPRGWLPGGAGLLVVTGSRAQRVGVAPGTAEVVVEAIPGLEDRHAEIALVIPG